MSGRPGETRGVSLHGLTLMTWPLHNASEADGRRIYQLPLPVGEGWGEGALDSVAV
jgi:hypothetical protein